MTKLSKTVWIGRVAPQLWLHSTTALISAGFYYPANGLIVEQKRGSLLIDTGYRPEQTETLLQWANRTLAAPVSVAFVTHFHDDRTGGIPALKQRGIRALARPLTCELARAHGFPVPEAIPNFDRGAYRFTPECELYFPGPGHTKDNVLAWFGAQRVLFGGCFLKSITSKSLGNLADANIPAWTASLHRVRERYPDPAIAIPGHGTIAPDALATTERLLAEAQAR